MPSLVGGLCTDNTHNNAAKRRMTDKSMIVQALWWVNQMNQKLSGEKKNKSYGYTRSIQGDWADYFTVAG